MKFEKLTNSAEEEASVFLTYTTYHAILQKRKVVKKPTWFEL